MTDYLTAQTFRDSSIASNEAIDEVDDRYPTFIAQQIKLASSWIDSRLRKRYAVPFEAPFPAIVEGWCAAIVTHRVMHKRGIDSTDEQAQDYENDLTNARAEILEAANGETGLYELPLREDNAASAVVAPTPFSSSASSPYVWMDEQARAGYCEDANGSGTTR